ncbi:scarecrow-like protein 14 [Papaver somniferum]|uniref:scarecrow-like protein 14 n=1 Tax=Papaver somniferum TaxID=3469 RepID=UPI000E702FCD|nr:scarecrow-like protein 14 [Papaver somniferum]XP_026400909.1 scarecrow-like protein 14 [Papaver somniferum]
MDQNHNYNDCSGIDTSSPNVSQVDEINFPDAVLKYINQMLMEESNEETNFLFQEDSPALQIAEKSFYEILGEEYPTSSPDSNPEIQIENFTHYSGSENAAETSWSGEFGAYESLANNTQSVPSDCTFQAAHQLSYNLSNSFNSAAQGLVESGVGKVRVPDVHSESESIWQFRKGVEEANKFLPDDNNLIINLERNGFFYGESKKEGGEAGDVVVELDKDVRQISSYGLRKKKNVHREDIELEGQSNKQLAAVQTAMFDMVLLCNGENGEKANSVLRESLKIETSKNSHQNGGRSRSKKHAGKRDLVDLQTLLIRCAQAVAAGDGTTASELLKQIRQHSSPYGDGSQRLAHCFAYGLEARLAGSGSQIYSTLPHKTPSAADLLKAYQLFMVALPFQKISNLFANQTIGHLAENATALHVIDFGILYGLQWPCLIRQLSKRKGGPPKLRITGIELPRPGFRPAERVEETGRRLRDYAKELNVPFEYHGIAQRWETIQLEDLKINKDELLVANCMYRARNLLDESVILDSPRDAVLNLIRKMNPRIFVHGIVNGTYNSPFFVTRFREALFHFSSMFDALETIVPHENPERILIERNFLGKEAFNIIACEGSERVERPETFKQWQSRNIKAGFMHLPLNTDIMKKAKEQARLYYHKDFVIDEDSRWLLLGWKGRIIFAISSWRPL